MNHRPLLCVLAGFVLGEVWIYQFHETAAKAVFCLCAVIFVMICMRKKGSFFVLIFLLIGAFIGAFRYMYWTSCEEKLSRLLHSDECYLEGQIIEERETTTGVLVVLDQLCIDRKDYIGKVTVYLQEGVSFPLGCTMKLKGELDSFSDATNPGEFDYQAYQKGKGIWACIYKPDVLSVRYGSFLIKEGIYWFRERTAAYLQSSMADSQYGIAMAMVLGEKSELLEEQKSLFEAGGISHILAVSGLHMTLIGAGIYKIFRKIGFSYGVSVLSSFPCIIAYAMMTGAGASCLRASVMLVVYLVAEWRGYVYDLPSSLALSGLWLLWEIPDRLFDSGFLLSFGAMIAISIIWPFLAQIFEYQTGKRRLRDSFFSGVVIAVFTLPLSLYFFYGISMAGLMLNLVVIPLMSILVPLLAFGGIGWMGICPDMVSNLFLYLAGLVIDFYQWLCQIVGMIPGAYIRIGYRGVWFGIIYYGLLFAFMAVLYKSKNGYLNVIIIATWFFMVIILILATGRDDSFMTVLDVGQGDGVLYHSETGKVCMMDGGSTSKKNVGTYVIEPALEYYGIASVDYWFISHMDEDHISGVKELLKKGYPVEYLILPELKEKTEEQIEFEKLAIQNGTEILYMNRGDKLQIGEEHFYCLHPSSNVSSNDTNQNSLVLLLSALNQEILLTGDVEKEGEEEMTEYLLKYFQQNDLSKKADSEKERILKVAHHGSANGSSEEFLEVFAPDMAIVSCGKKNRYGHPAKETVERIHNVGSKLLNTAQVGAVEIRLDGKAKYYGFCNLK